MKVIKCPRCGSVSFVKSGISNAKSGKKWQRYRCKRCRYNFVWRDGYQYKKKNPQEVIDFAVALSKSNNPAYSSRDISRMILEKFGLKVSNVAVLRWLPKVQIRFDSPIDSIIDIPCFACLMNKEVSPSQCFPASCLRFEKWSKSIEECSISA